MNSDLFGLVLALGLTLAVLSYLIGDNPFYRIALHLLVGVSSGYAAFIALRTLVFTQVIYGVLYAPDVADMALTLIPIVGVLLIVLKVRPKWNSWGGAVMGFLVGVGAAVALQSLLLGTLLPLLRSSMVSLDWAQAVAPGSSESAAGQAANLALLTVGTVLALLFFFYGGFRPPTGHPAGQFYRPVWFSTLTTAGQVFVVVALAALYAGALNSGISLLTERLFFLFDGLTALLNRFA